MAKRSWTEMNAAIGAQTPAQARPVQFRQGQPPARLTQGDPNRGRGDTASNQAPCDSNPLGAVNGSAPHLSRKITACTSCRKHKVSNCFLAPKTSNVANVQQIKCVVDQAGQPCRRCAKHGLGCVLTKNLQTIIDEKAR